MSRVLQLQFRPSAALSAAVLLVHAGALVCAWIALSSWILVLVAAGLGLSCLGHWRRARLGTAQSLCGLAWRPAGLELHFPGRMPQIGVFCGGAAPTRFWALLRARDAAGKRVDALIGADACEAEAFRRLRMRLRWHPVDGPAEGK